MLKQYYGTKRIQAKPMTRGDYNHYRGWTLPEGENPEDNGYLVVYPDSDANTPDYNWYVSWSPKKVFEDAYQEFTSLSFSHALEAIKQGHKVARSGWNGKGMFVFLVNGSKFKVNRAPLLGIYPEGTEINYHAHIYMKTADGQIVPWLASQTDVLANDWTVLE